MIGDANPDQPRMGDRTADEGHLAHSRKPDVGDVLSATTEEAVVLLARKPRTHAGLGQDRELPWRNGAVIWRQKQL